MKQVGEQIRGNYFVQADEILGQGAFGKTLKCRKINDPLEYQYCMKIISKQVNQEKQKMAFLNEIEAVKNLMHHYCENVTEIIDVFENEEDVHIIMELCDMDLSKEFQNNLSKGWYSRLEQINIMKQIIQGMKHLFKKNMIHRDIKPPNILIKVYKQGNEFRKVYKISDFGFCRTLDEYYEQTNLTRIGTRDYCAPQLFLDGQSFSGKCDIFSIGILFYQICYQGELPSFARYHNETELLKLKDKPFKCTYLDGEYGAEIMQLIERMLAYEENQRIRFEEIFKHKLFNLKFPICNDPLIIPFVLKNLIIGDQNERINKIIEIFSRKFLFCEYMFEQFDAEFFLPSIETDMAKYFILLIGMQQLTYALGMIHQNITDIHSYFVQDNDATHLLEILSQYKNQQTIKLIRNKYFNHAQKCRQFLDKLKKQILQQEKKEYDDILKYCLAQKYEFNFLRDQLETLLYKTSLRESFEKIEMYSLIQFQKLQNTNSQTTRLGRQIQYFQLLFYKFRFHLLIYYIIMQIEQQRGDYFIFSNQLLGQGCFGQTFKCRKGKDVYCMKIISKKLKNDNTEKMTYGNEIDAVHHLMNTYCENVTEVIDIFDDENNVYIVMELCDLDLLQEFSNMNNKWYSRNEQLYIIRQIMNGMKHLFKHQMIHRDIKPENILIKKYKKGNETMKIYKISDFGFSKTLIEVYEQQNISFLGTAQYCSPQILAHQQFSAKCDIFSLGILFYQIFYQAELPYFSKSDQRERILQLKATPFQCPQLEGEYAEEIKSLLERMIVYEEERRIKFEDIFNHKLFTMSLCLTIDPLIVPSDNQMDHLYERINMVLSLFYRKFQLCDSAVKNFEVQIHLPTLDSNLCYYLILSIGKLQITYAFALIYCNISDLHPYFQNQYEIMRLSDIVSQFRLESKNNETYSQTIKKIREAYFQQAQNFQDKTNNILKDLCENASHTQDTFELASIHFFQEFLDKSGYQIISFNNLRSQLYKTLYKTSFSECFHRLDKNLHSQILKILEIETRFKISNYYFIDLDLL